MKRFDRHVQLPRAYDYTDFFGSCAAVFKDKVVVVGHINTNRRKRAYWLNGTQVFHHIIFQNDFKIKSSDHSGIRYQIQDIIVTELPVQFIRKISLFVLVVTLKEVKPVKCYLNI